MSENIKLSKHKGLYLIVGAIELQDGGKAYRVLNTKDNTCTDEYKEDIIFSIRQGATFRNARVENGKLVGVNGKLARYPYITDKDSPVTIVRQYVDSANSIVGFEIVNNTGRVHKLSKEKTCNLLNTLVKRGVETPLTNGRFDGERISPIIGLYESVRIKSRDRDNKSNRSSKATNEDINKMSKSLLINVCKHYSKMYGRTVSLRELKYYPFGVYFKDMDSVGVLAQSIYSKYGTFKGLKLEYSRGVFRFCVTGYNSSIIYSVKEGRKDA